ncbi:tRNA (adenosine(37)-N6)-dimethylallyltransferase MiaA [Myroides odoratimimus]|uniref:tRNA (adenosine(37)-N6)-dimethylallyltransferase MiaA n=1 Tax=Myroides odoratimimus TaxID=76832 RepID=UPI0024BF8109|nr:tRNA (adenosine(37)-N6)-dimethylallyltransferase MiaA [Myroides odoratimimus]WHU37588.1 tRNA (adenosine(37)-N6)-dimethylallyltransferase MiaA [Myroides odoratimimus]
MSTKNNNYLIVVIGPTAIGKTALGIKLAQHFNTNIISCDSRQFYKEMAIGTAVPSKEELAAAPHHFIQNISIHDTYSVGDFEREALAKLDELFTDNPVQVMVGGSGLFVNAILNGLDDFPDVDPGIREQLNQDLAEKGLPYLQNMLKELDPIHYEKVAIDNPQRVTRALEICIGTGKPYSSFLNIKQHTRNFTPIVIGLEADREKMYERINKRVDIMLDNGLLKEAQELYPYRDNNALQTVGYRELFAYFDNEFTLEFAIEEIKKNTRRFAKRQITWFKRTPDVMWFDYLTAPERMLIRLLRL